MCVAFCAHVNSIYSVVCRHPSFKNKIEGPLSSSNRGLHIGVGSHSLRKCGPQGWNSGGREGSSP